MFNISKQKLLKNYWIFVQSWHERYDREW